MSDPNIILAVAVAFLIASQIFSLVKTQELIDEIKAMKVEGDNG